MSEQNEFVFLVGRMRHFQRRWNRYHKQADLVESKSLERQVDRQLERDTGMTRPWPLPMGEEMVSEWMFIDET